MQQWTRRRDLWTKSFVNPACNIQVPAAPCFWHGHLLVKKGTCIRLCLSQWDSNCSFVANHVHAWNRGTLFTISHLSLWPKHFKAWAYLSISQCGLFLRDSFNRMRMGPGPSSYYQDILGKDTNSPTSLNIGFNPSAFSKYKIYFYPRSHIH